MIRFSDAIILALTKLKTRRLRTTLTVIIASLLFSTLVAATLIIQGGLDSFSKFSEQSLAGKYLVSATYQTNTGYANDSTPDSVKKRALEIYNKTITDKKAAAKKLGIEYDPTSEQKPIDKFGDTEYLMGSAPSAAKALYEYALTQPSAKELLTKKLNDNGFVKAYESTYSNISDGGIKVLKNNTEDFTQSDPMPNGSYSTMDVSSGWTYIDQAIAKPFMLSDEQLKRQTNTTDIPIIAPISKVEEALGLKKLAKNTSPTEKLDRIKYIKNHAETATFTACYRNSTSQSQIASAIATAKEITANKNNKDYIKPSLIYGLPDAGSCAPVKIISDTRTESEKSYARKQAEFDKLFDNIIDPVQQKITFRVVGLSPESANSDSLSDISGIISMIAGSTLNGSWVVPNQLFESMPNYHDFDRFVQPTKPTDAMAYSYSHYIVELKDAEAAKHYYKDLSCSQQWCNEGMMISYFGINSVLIDEMKEQCMNFLKYAAVIVGAISAIIMMGMTGRVIVDSRRETAVFRAIGAKRNDIRLIYNNYTLILCFIIIITTFILGFIEAAWVNYIYSPNLTIQAHLTYIFSNDNLTFLLIGLWPQALIIIAILIVLVGVAGMALPLSRNLQRSPIKDMRDDT